MPPDSATTGPNGAGPSPAVTSTPTTKTLAQRLSTLVLSAQFLWFVGHVTTVIQALSYVVLARFGYGGPKNYTKAFYGTLVSYGIIMYKAHGIPQFSGAYLQHLLQDENTWYLLLAINWALSKPLLVTLLPYVVFSLFHSLNYFRSEVAPVVLPPTQFPAITPRIQRSIVWFVQSFQTRALRTVAFIEVFAIMPVLVVGIFFGWSSFMAPLLYSRFLIFRYHTSGLTKQAFAELKARMDAAAAHPRVPPAVKKMYAVVQEKVADMGQMPGQPAAAAGAQ
ncbi:hypothetical protein HDU90_002915 [Geranomyces variabilis]|nr:hypothetical protein HDU90_002915 [Geranomyces variabilis]